MSDDTDSKQPAKEALRLCALLLKDVELVSFLKRSDTREAFLRRIKAIESQLPAQGMAPDEVASLLITSKASGSRQRSGSSGRIRPGRSDPSLETEESAPFDLLSTLLIAAAHRPDGLTNKTWITDVDNAVRNPQLQDVLSQSGAGLAVQTIHDTRVKRFLENVTVLSSVPPPEKDTRLPRGIERRLNEVAVDVADIGIELGLMLRETNDEAGQDFVELAETWPEIGAATTDFGMWTTMVGADDDLAHASHFESAASRYENFRTLVRLDLKQLSRVGLEGELTEQEGFVFSTFARLIRNNSQFVQYLKADEDPLFNGMEAIAEESAPVADALQTALSADTSRSLGLDAH